ncbi:hypothetical protein ACFW04_008399 [Cataglyphis niger]
MSGINIWNNVFDIYINETDNRYLRFLACSENIAIIQKYTTLITLEDCNGIMKNKNCLNSFHFIIAKHAKNSLMLDYILAYFERIVPRQATVAILIDIINHVYSTEHLNKVHQFTEKYSKKLILKVEHKIKIRLSEIKNQMNQLKLLHN